MPVGHSEIELECPLFLSSPLFNMALQLISLKTSKQPIYNEYSNSTLYENNLRLITETLYKRIKETPELVSMLDTVVTDHFLGPVDFFDPSGKPLGPTKLKQVQTFWEEQNVQGEAYFGQGLDLFIDGSSFGWYANAAQLLSVKQKESFAKIKALNSEIGTFMEEQMHLPRKVAYLAASTITIKHDDTGILYYIQDAGGSRYKWDKDNVVHVKLMDFNGEVRGFSPLKSLVKEIVIMYMLKDNMMAKMYNGGSPDMIISLKGANGVSKARFERLRTALESFSHLKKSHGNMPIDAEIETHEMGTAMKDMEYRELAMFIISEFALALGLPSSRVPFLMTGSGGTSNKGELSGNSEDAYQAKINARRTIWENGWNKVFRRAGFTAYFRRTNLQDDVRETQASSQRAAYVVSVQTSLAKAQKQLTLQAHLELLSGTKTNLSEEDVEDMAIMVVNDMGGASAGMGGPMQPDNKSKSTVGRDYQAAKEKTASNNGVYT